MGCVGCRFGRLCFVFWDSYTIRNRLGSRNARRYNAPRPTLSETLTVSAANPVDAEAKVVKGTLIRRNKRTPIKSFMLVR